MEKIKKLSEWLNAKKVAISFAIAALIGGFLFMNHSITGNVILNNKYSFSFVSLIGLLLILCSIILGVYSVRKKD